MTHSQLNLAFIACICLFISVGKGFVLGCTTCDDTGKDRFQQTCKICNGLGIDYKIQCSECKGKGGLLVIPDNAKSLPTTGVVLSMGPKTEAMQYTKIIRKNQKYISKWWFHLFFDERPYYKAIEELRDTPVRLGARVIFGPHVGTMIPFKGNIKLKIMRVHEPLAVIFGKDTAARDFIDYETEQY